MFWYPQPLAIGRTWSFNDDGVGTAPHFNQLIMGTNRGGLYISRRPFSWVKPHRTAKLQTAEQTPDLRPHSSTTETERVGRERTGEREREVQLAANLVLRMARECGGRVEPGKPGNWSE